jgi:farnesyl diphosphate synthase
MFKTRLQEAADRIAAHLATVFDAFPAGAVTEGMRHATDGGKRLRGFLVLEGAALHQVPVQQALWPACAIEALHAYSLVHDDLPCMDDDDLRRGRPTVHVRWDEPTAILVGDALQALAFELATHPQAGTAEARATLAQTLAQAAGGTGMVHGQALDIAAETAAVPLSLAQITRLQAGKTGALIEWSAMAGPRMAGADTDPLRRYATALGLAFQIADDLMDLEGDTDKAGKRLQKDAAAGKATFVSLLGPQDARRRAQELIEEACAALDPYGPAADALRQAAGFVISRES